VTGFTNQMSFLMGLGVEEMIAQLAPETPEFRAALHLLKPEGMDGPLKFLSSTRASRRRASMD
jgi:SAM-dependent MidA family methyltransferase